MVATPTPEAAVAGLLLECAVTLQKATRLASTGVGLDLHGDPIALTAALVDIPSESRDEQRIADEVEAALREQSTGFEIVRTGNTVLARTNRGLPSRVILAGHLDTVPIADNVPSRLRGDELHGCGTSDMKSGDAVFLHLAATVDEPAHDITLVMYDCEEIEASANSLGRIERELPDWLRADVAILGEPSGGFIEAGCQGTLRVVVSATGTRAHSARSWLGDNAIHKLGAVLDRLSAYEARTVDIDGCVYREGLSAVRIDGGVAGNVIPDAASVTINFRFAPDRSVEQADGHIRDMLDGLDVQIEQTDAAPGALPGLTKPAAAALVEAAGGQARAKYGWTDVARFAALGVPAVNFGPGDPNLAHRVDERVEVKQITAATDMLRRYLTA
jgi:succinyl-diaminopimelate desuccinylase